MTVALRRRLCERGIDFLLSSIHGIQPSRLALSGEAVDVSPNPGDFVDRQAGFGGK